MIKVKKIKPMFTALITTMDMYEEDAVTKGGIIDTTKQKGTIKEYQKVLAVGSTVKDIKVGDLVSIDPTRYAVKKHKEDSLKVDIEGSNPVLEYRFDIVEMDDKKCLLLQDRDIQFIIEEYEEVEDITPKVITPPTDLIV